MLLMACWSSPRLCSLADRSLEKVCFSCLARNFSIVESFLPFAASLLCAASSARAFAFFSRLSSSVSILASWEETPAALVLRVSTMAWIGAGSLASAPGASFLAPLRFFAMPTSCATISACSFFSFSSARALVLEEAFLLSSSRSCSFLRASSFCSFASLSMSSDLASSVFFRASSFSRVSNFSLAEWLAAAFRDFSKRPWRPWSFWMAPATILPFCSFVMPLEPFSSSSATLSTASATSFADFATSLVRWPFSILWSACWTALSCASLSASSDLTSSFSTSVSGVSPAELLPAALRNSWKRPWRPWSFWMAPATICLFCSFVMFLPDSSASATSSTRSATSSADLATSEVTLPCSILWSASWTAPSSSSPWRSFSSCRAWPTFCILACLVRFLAP
mmetsp:Transcript_1820/g.3631  ORF Transcript_1820/g.3631 Transcript_1820/m.3631 type:complete len:396 (-) Transcript_1820:342-1529(-)